MLEIYTDGACEGNPGPGGWGALIIDGDARRELSGAEPATTNNRMELLATIEGLKATEGPVRLYTDSQYVKLGMTEWIKGWKRNGWKTADRKPVKNQDLWMMLDALCAGRAVDWRWVRGHAGHPENERADALARNAVAVLKAARRRSSG
jgi:ribonuclease HI